MSIAQMLMNMWHPAMATQHEQLQHSVTLPAINCNCSITIIQQWCQSRGVFQCISAVLDISESLKSFRVYLRDVTRSLGICFPIVEVPPAFGLSAEYIGLQLLYYWYCKNVFVLGEDRGLDCSLRIRAFSTCWNRCINRVGENVQIIIRIITIPCFT